MTRMGFDYALDEMHNDLLRMGSIVEKQIHKCIESLVNHDEDLARQTIKNDDLVDDLQREIEDKCIKLTAKEQPLAIDLRTIFTTTKLVTDLERMADHAVDIAKVTIRLKDEDYGKELVDIPEMSRIVNEMIKIALDSYVKRDVKMAYEACNMDDKIDALFKNVFTEMLKIMVKDGSKINQMTQLLFVCKYLERIADRVTNVCEGTIYLVTGEQKDLNE
ncbi:MAG: phosphate signaling complex protein PhoU [Clostridium sp.]|jgi:phosphate transport system protein|uniref:phosphate signaling complex protein PhoU n=1 Tax=Clostridium sp. TaxID=1506 RepID=UPI0025C7209F|nr:phosphate signaling complex protein PhoU [Clostridium sp.]MCH3964060.1 phosphate signaling complex protein PhoU [Clostridium sp.]MCI1716261.1 phosphate signaling complex protein PhoU [Clostridium sp.]MCI1800499.1 phosphate signaling complex protein PhoU [Clostridium sp.]MCI1814438.1 phosphate signaling complex protein PhoU [Clostridium sp.]MCI1871337.1 phosphate signaling complex protein PhoU [Clostridium sp.]